MLPSADDSAYVGTGASAGAEILAFSVLGDKLLYRGVTSSVNGNNKVAELLTLDTITNVLTSAFVSGVSSSQNNQVGIFNGFSSFFKQNFTPGISTVLYKTDGINPAVTVKTFPQFDSIFEFTEVNGELFFVIDRELWKTDGTEAGTTMVKDINPGGFDNSAFFPLFG